MYLKDLRLNGFKSFADATHISLDPGVTTIVGPNGCGKSNIADAIRWVLGEQSAKSLRAGVMQDVIFQGTELRKPVNLCEVSLLFSDCEEELGTAFNEVEITRRVSRDGSSEYLLNGKGCRLKDIHGLFLDTGVGRVSYSFMVQGQIDQILSTNPAERRTIFEEAAGISKYKAQRREALNKLNLVDINLARVTDVIEEVSRQITSLKRQAGKALRYQRIKRRLTHLDLSSNAVKFKELKDTIETLEKESEREQENARTLDAAIARKERELNQKREERSHSYESLQSVQQTVFDLRSEKEQAENRAEFAVLRAKDLRARIKEISLEIKETKKERKALQDRATGDSRSKEEQLSLVFSSDDVFKNRNQELENLLEAISREEDQLQERKQELLMTESGLTRLRSNCTSLEVDLKSYQVHHSNLSDEIYQLKNDRTGLEKGLKNIRKALEKRRVERSKEEKAFGGIRKKLEKERESFKDLQREIQETDRKRAELTAQIGILEKLEEQFEGFSEGAKSILKGKLGETLEAGTYRVLTKNLRIERGYTMAMITLLGPAVDSLVLDDPDKVVAVTEELEFKKLGRACLQIKVPPVKLREKGNLPAWLRPAREVVGSTVENFGEALSNLLADCYFCESLPEFFRYWKENPEIDFLYVATRTGELVDRRGLIFGGRKKGQSKTSLQRLAEIKSLREAREKAEKKIGERQEKSVRQLARLEEGERGLEEKRGKVSEISQEISNALGQELSATEHLEQNEKRMQEAEKELSGLEKNKLQSSSRLEKAREELEKVESRLKALRRRIEEKEKTVARLRGEGVEKRESLADVRLELAEKRQRLEIIDRGLSEMEKQTEEMDLSLLKRDQETDTLHEQIRQFEEESQEYAEKAGELEKTLKVTQAGLEKDREKVLTFENEIKKLEETLSLQREEHRRTESSHNRYEIELAKKRSTLDFLREEVSREYDADLDAIDWKREFWKAGDELKERIKLDLDDESFQSEGAVQERGEPTAEDLAKLDQIDWGRVGEEIQMLRGRINLMGPVNLIAIEEYRELRDRHAFLKSQSDDLWKSKDQLLAAIDEINQTSLSLFRETFDQVRKNFAFTFKALFGGGHTDLQLVDREDVLESGIDIIARPPGTRLKTLALLSGGQKTMTAVALLFAIYMVKPSPFCLLDELDASLDDSNIVRFVKMLKQFTKYSQFIIITHNKRTIASSNSIFGVTMQEKGVSKLVSMRFNARSEKAEAIRG